MTTAKSVGKIYSYPGNARVFKAQIAAAYNNVAVEVAADFEMGVTNKSAGFLAKFPLGKVPVMETPEGALYESDAIAYYVANAVANSTLLGSTPYEKALVQQYVSFGSLEVSANTGKWLYPLLGMGTYNKDNEKLAKEALTRALVALNVELLNKTFLVGERITLADISVACHLIAGYTKLFDADYRKPFPNVTRWFLTVVNQPKVKAIVGEIALCTATLKYDAKKAAAASAPKAEKPKKEAAAPQEESLEDIAAAEAKAEAKKKNPLDELPPSSLVLDNWKRFYSNNSEADSCKWFWENYDPQGYSLWKVEYKYQEELGAIFMSSNLIGGFFQRLDRARKYAFGSMLVTGEANDNKITGYFVFRGQDVPFEVTDAADYESYKFTKADASSPTVRAEFNDYISWAGPNLPGKFQDGKIFK